MTGETAVFQGAAALIAATIVLAMRIAGRRQGPHWAVAALIVVVAANASHLAQRAYDGAGARRDAAALLAMIDRIPPYRALREARPEAFAPIRRAAVEIADADEPLAVKARRADAIVGPLLQDYLRTRVATMDDAMTVRMVRLTGDHLRRVAAIDPAECDREAWDPAAGVGATPDRRMADETAAFAADLIRSEPLRAEQVTTLTDEERDALTRRMLPAVMRSTNMDPIQILLAMHGVGRTGARCAFAIAQGDELTAMPVHEAATAIRTFERAASAARSRTAPGGGAPPRPARPESPPSEPFTPFTPFTPTTRTTNANIT